MLNKQLLTISIAAILGLSLLFSFLGVYSNQHLSFPMRIMFWAFSSSVGALAALALLPSVINGRLRALHIAKKLALISIVSAAPPLLVNRAFGASRSLEEWLVQYFMSLVVTSLVIVSVYTVYRATRSPKLENPTEALNRRANYCTEQFLKRLPIQYQTAELYAVSSDCLLYTSPSPRDLSTSRMPSSA